MLGLPAGCQQGRAGELLRDRADRQACLRSHPASGIEVGKSPGTAGDDTPFTYHANNAARPLELNGNAIHFRMELLDVDHALLNFRLLRSRPIGARPDSIFLGYCSMADGIATGKILLRYSRDFLH